MKRPFRTLFRFDEPDHEFELLETEQGGTPPFFARRKTQSPQKTPHVFALSKRLDRNEEALSACFHREINPDLIVRRFSIGKEQPAMLVFLTGMASEQRINEFLLTPALRSEWERPKKEPLRFAMERVFALHEMELTDDWEVMELAISEGRTAIFLEGCRGCILSETRGYISRAVSEPKAENVVLGPHEAFNENLRTNVTLLRKLIRLPDLVVRFMETGGRNRTRLALGYIEGVCNRDLIREVEKRLKKVDTTAVLSSGTLEQLIETYTFFPLPQVLKTERPDRAAGAILQGKLVLLVEGSPIACVLPVTLGTLFSSAEDTYLRQPVGTLVRIVRALGALLSVFMPGYFLALALHHPGQLSSEVLATVVASRIMVFLPLSVEMIFLLLVFQLVREAGLRIPGSIGHAIGIIGGLILGQAAVSANIVSTVVLIIVALTGLGNFAIPDYSTQQCIAYYRVALCLLATAGGLLGMTVGVLCTVALLCSVKSFGIPFLSPIAPVVRRHAPLIVRGKLQEGAKTADAVNAEGVL